MNVVNERLWAIIKVLAYCLIVLGIIGALTVFVIIPQWIKTPELPVPNIIGKKYYDAVNVLNEAGLQIASPIQLQSSDLPKGHIVAQKPPSGTRIKAYQPVEVSVSIGTELVLVPSVIGKSKDAAYDTLRTAGFTPNRMAYVHSGSYPPDTVIAQTPAEGSRKRRLSFINLLISLGTHPQYIRLPNLQNQPIDDVVSALEEGELHVEVQYRPHPRIPQGAVITHKPIGGALVQSGDLISLEVSGVQGETGNIGRLLRHKHTVSEAGDLSRHVKIVVIDDYGKRTEVDEPYAPGTVIDLERKRVRVFGETRVIIYENDEKLDEVVYH